MRLLLSTLMLVFALTPISRAHAQNRTDIPAPVFTVQQEAPIILQPNVPILIEWDYETNTGMFFSMVVDESITKNFVSSDYTVTGPINGVYTYRATAPGIKPGAHKAKLRAHLGNPTEAGMFADSDELSLKVTPTKPKLRISSPGGSGDLVLEFTGLTVEGVKAATETTLRVKKPK